MKIIKRNGQEVDFDRLKIKVAILKANKSVADVDKISDETAETVSLRIEDYVRRNGLRPSVEDVQDLVEVRLMEMGYHKLAQEYIKYRYQRQLVRKANTTDEKIMSLINLNNQEIKEENSNKNPIINSTQRDYMAGEVSKDICRRFILPEDIKDAHDKGIIHFHDADYAVQRMHNCDLVDLEDMLQNGTVISGVKIDTPRSFYTACNVATQIIAQVASNQYGGQTISLAHLAPFVDVSRRKFRNEVIAEYEKIFENVQDLEYKKPRKVLGSKLSKEKEKFYKNKEHLLKFMSATDIEEIVENKVKDEIKRGIQTLQYQIITLQTTNGQSPFVSVFMYLNEVEEGQQRNDLALIIEEVLHQRIQGVKNEKGVWTTPAFPKLLYVLQEDNLKEGSKWFYLSKLAAECAAKRMVPDFISEKIMLENKIDKLGNGNVYGPMGCRSFLTPYVDDNGKSKYYGRFNQGVVTINLIDVACSSGKNLDSFWNILHERLEMCHRALRIRHEHLLGTPSDVAPILWQHGALARLQPGEKIDKLLFGGYSTISLGYAGLWETVFHMTGKEMTSPEGEKFGLEVMSKLNEYTNKWKKEENIDYSIYGTPIESTTYKFAKCLQNRFGIIKGVTDKKYITNSYHVNVTKNIDAFSKLAFESKFQKLSPGGAISYVEVPPLQDNLKAVLSIMSFIYHNIMYAELNTKLDYCMCCGYNKQISLINIEGTWKFECPNCGNKDKTKMDIARRTCGYLGKNDWNQGRLEEIAERVVHVGNGTDYEQ